MTNDKISLVRFGFDVNAKLRGLDPVSDAAEAEVLRRHGITAPTEKPQVDILKLNAEMSGR